MVFFFLFFHAGQTAELAGDEVAVWAQFDQFIILIS